MTDGRRRAQITQDAVELFLVCLILEQKITFLGLQILQVRFVLARLTSLDNVLCCRIALDALDSALFAAVLHMPHYDGGLARFYYSCPLVNFHIVIRHLLYISFQLTINFVEGELFG